ncbi:alpha/beta fold hydrolase [Mycolicibacterium phlei]|jgi:2-hydroxymuconate-semialdehyde hydrolase/2-hydroxy-6-oxo-octa-2,4-dienoate hydrolase|uniref:alpha/beta fold hydrolase n=1 Tax=Mycolicibacterium phlei TaxID=1771 RepID=UPI00025AE220|nr:alpha/beta fold hydrolase [Mycolicibacterium phlei]EID10493.1 2,6-dioxo-6-phenylhexa-3-enoate hydrolase [Mycolicibacterium phlei RIVM601174]MBF4194795.1 2,6-dioxo-6-phenylhexa-3-enoate hydrolase [Mycolicibacterium phlei]PZN25556.1 MAG: 2-hydroxy-6-oxo-2,4-heptadienoate hydrolase [Mycolicibacterium hassiacum]
MTTQTAPAQSPARRTITAGGIATAYLEAGTGAPVLMLHGSGPGVSALANWQNNIPTLAQRFRVLAPDIVGFGATERPADIIYSLRTWTDHVWAFLDAHEIDRVAVVGNSLGGRIALQMATDHPDRISRMVLMGAPGVGMVPTDGLKALRAYQPSREAMRDLLRNYFAVDPELITDELVETRYAASIADGAHETYRAMFFDPKHAGSQLGITEDEVRAIATPTLLVHGREDKVVPLSVSITMLDLLPNADLHVFSRCGHWTQIERGAEFSALVSDFLSRN